ncbi:MAG: thioredoxin fold domain-containing protein [Sedimenticola sp.]|nr:thioredoxin fold domain-containing protein [Sedimenticola sp.]MCW8946868.1 thioredoxin fold domain-containing protein [Sedimenticola sp.]
MKSFSSALLALTLITLSFLIQAAPLNTPKVFDWSLEASTASKGNKPIMVVFSSDRCNYCDLLNQQVLNPLLKSGDLANRVHLREFKIDRSGKVVDFDGDPIRSHIFVSRYNIYATPTVLLLDQNGNILGEPIVGFNNPVTYKILLDKTIQQAQSMSHISVEKIVTSLQ